MTQDPGRWRRRAFLGGVAGLASLPWTARAGRTDTALDNPLATEMPTILVASPETSQAGLWARRLQPFLSVGLMTAAPLQLNFRGGRDGVTGANRYEASTPDGDDALLVPGAAFLAQLAGDSRVRFDLADKIVVLAALSPGLLMLRGKLTAPRKTRLRVACDGPIDPSLSALLGLELLGIGCEPIELGTNAATAARAGRVDAVFLTGADISSQRRLLAQAGLVPGFAVTQTDIGGTMPRDPAWQDVPTLPDLLPATQAATPLAAAWRAVAAASLLGFALTLPPLSGAWVTRWRRAASTTMGDPQVSGAAALQHLRFAEGSAAGAAVQGTQADPAAEIALRSWLESRLKWRPS